MNDNLRHDQDKLDGISAENAASDARKEAVRRLAALVVSLDASFGLSARDKAVWLGRRLDRHPEICRVLERSGYVHGSASWQARWGLAHEVFAKAARDAHPTPASLLVTLI